MRSSPRRGAALADLIAEGVTTVEIKSGLRPRARDGNDACCGPRAASGGRRRSRVVTSFLGAHAFPPGIERQAYVELVAREMIPTVVGEGLADMVDAFCDAIAFSVDGDPAGLRGGAEGRPAAAAPCRAIVAHRRHRAGRRVRRPVGRPRRICKRGGCRRDGPRRHGRRAAARRLPHAARDAGTAGRGLSPPRRGDGGLDRRQSRLLADDLDPPRHEHGLRPLPPDRARGGRRRDARGGAGARPARRDRHARGRQELRPRHLVGRAPRRAALPHGRQSAPPARLRGERTHELRAGPARARAAFRQPAAYGQCSCRTRSCRASCRARSP